MKISIRKFKSSETDFLEEMFYEALYVPEGKEPYPLSIIHHPDLVEYTCNWGKPHDIAFVAENGSEKIGLIWSRIFPPEKPGYGHIDDNVPEISVAVKADYRNKGVGRQLFDTLLNEMRNQGYKKVSLSVDIGNRAINLYTKVGFEIIKETKEDYVMLKHLG